MSTALRPAADTIAQNWAALGNWLAARGAALGGRPVRQFAGGFGNLNYLIEVDGRPAVLRRPPPGELPRGANDMAREYRILSSLWRAYPLAPRALWFCPDPAVLGASFEILEYRAGIVIGEVMPPAFAGRPETGAVLSRGLVESLAALHAVAPQEVGLDTLGRPAGFLARTIDGWASRGAAVAEPGKCGALAETAAWLRRHLPAEIAPSLIHSDFKLDNMILEPMILTPVAVIDWDMGTRGDPLWDLAVLLSYWAEPGDRECIHRLRQMPTAQPGFWRRAEVLAAYQRSSGHAVNDFPFYRVLALFRLSIVFRQLFERYRRDPSANRRCAQFDRLAAELLDYAFDTARGRAEP